MGRGVSHVRVRDRGYGRPGRRVLTSADLEEDVEHDRGVDSLAFLYEVHDGSILVRPEHQVHHVLPYFLSLLAPLRFRVHQSQQVRVPKPSHNLNLFFRQLQLFGALRQDLLHRILLSCLAIHSKVNEAVTALAKQTN